MEPVMEGQTPGGIIVWVRPEEHRAASEIEFKALIKMLQRENSVLRVFPLKREIEHNSFSQMEIMQGAKNLFLPALQTSPQGHHMSPDLSRSLKEPVILPGAQGSHLPTPSTGTFHPPW